MPVEVIGNKEPLPTTIEVGVGYRGKVKRERVSGREVMWEVAPESKYQLFVAAWFRETVLKADARDY